MGGCAPAEDIRPSTAGGGYLPCPGEETHKRPRPGASGVSRYRVGCTGWGYDDWRGGFYPPGAEAGEYLDRYARVFDFVEVDSSYYRPPSSFLTGRWARTTPPGFTFALKVPREVTHRALAEPLDDTLERFLDGLEPLRRAGKLGPVVAQFPASFRAPKAEARLDEVLRRVPEGYRLAVELRHGSWWEAERLQRLRDRSAALVWTVVPGVQPPYAATAPFLYARFVGDRALTRFDRIQRDLSDEMRSMRRRFEDEGRDVEEVFAVVNNHFMGFAPGSANLLREVLGLPPADLGAAARDPGQQRLPGG